MAATSRPVLRAWVVVSCKSRFPLRSVYTFPSFTHIPCFCMRYADGNREERVTFPLNFSSVPATRQAVIRAGLRDMPHNMTVSYIFQFLLILASVAPHTYIGMWIPVLGGWASHHIALHRTTSHNMCLTAAVIRCFIRTHTAFSLHTPANCHFYSCL